MRSWKKHLPEWARCKESIGGIYWTEELRRYNLVKNLTISNPRLKAVEALNFCCHNWGLVLVCSVLKFHLHTDHMPAMAKTSRLHVWTIPKAFLVSGITSAALLCRSKCWTSVAANEGWFWYGLYSCAGTSRLSMVSLWHNKRCPLVSKCWTFVAANEGWLCCLSWPNGQTAPMLPFSSPIIFLSSHL